MVVREGDVYWYDFGAPQGSAPGYRRPVVVVQGELFNASALATVVVCALTSNTAMIRHPGNVAIGIGEANLDKESVAMVTQLFTVDRAYLADHIGTLPHPRLESIRLGIRLVLGDEDALDRLP
ncbi:MAG TPA: type II toxin-antitoxin system PemK/MazF family toxin [Chloroflexota bacterium]|nr:type II toxin-antitoxin system PemK/MazF family toxin [Chloroflexota bacterium]